MNKKYCLISTLSFIFMTVLGNILIFSKSNTYVTMTSIFIPIIFGIIINYDNSQKQIYKLYYLPLFYYIRTYYDIMSQPQEKSTITEKHEMMSNISKDLMNFLNDNVKYASEELSNMLSCLYYYKYINKKVQNENQDIYNINSVIPIITKELLEIYNVLYINDYLKRRIFINKKYHMVNDMIFLYVDSFLIDIARKKGYIITLSKCVKFYKTIDDYRNQHFRDYYKIYKFIKKNRNENIDLLIKELSRKFNIKIKNIK